MILRQVIILMLVVLLLAACADQKDSPTVGTLLPAATTTITPRPSTPTPTWTPSPSPTSTSTPTVTPIPNSPPEIVDMEAYDNADIMMEPIAPVNAYFIANGHLEKMKVFSGAGEKPSLRVTFSDSDGNLRRALLTIGTAKHSAAVDPLAGDIPIKPIGEDAHGDPLYEIHFTGDHSLNIGELPEQKATLVIEDEMGGLTSETFVLSKSIYEDGAERPLLLAMPQPGTEIWSAAVEADGLTFTPAIAQWFNENTQVAANLSIAIDGQTPFTWLELQRQGEYLQQRMRQTTEDQRVQLTYKTSRGDEQSLMDLPVPFYNRFRFIPMPDDPTTALRINASRNDAISEEDLDLAVMTFRRFVKNNPALLEALIQRGPFFAIIATELNSQAVGSLDGALAYAEPDMINEDACGIHMQRFTFVHDDCLGWEGMEQTDLIIIHELAHALQTMRLKPQTLNLAAELVAFGIELPYQHAAEARELKRGDETWAHLVESWFAIGSSRQLWEFWHGDREGVGRLLDVIKTEDSRTLREFMFELLGPPQDVYGNEYPDLVVAPDAPSTATPLAE